jgi:hypothetical protein
MAKNVKKLKEEIKNDIYNKGLELIKWHENPKNQWAGLIHANTSINAIQMFLDKIIPPKHGHN